MTDDPSSTSPFLKIDPQHWLASNELAFAIFDAYPVSPGHALVITRRVARTWFDATAEEQQQVMELVGEVKRLLDDRLSPKPDGYNVGFNCGEPAGQTVPHLHVHVIPRYTGDVPDPRGGVRYVIPEKANYLKDAPPEKPTTSAKLTKPAKLADDNAPSLRTGYPQSPLWDELAWRIAGAAHVDILASFVQMSGLELIESRLFDALQRAARIRILVSDYLYISDPKALQTLLAWTELSDVEPDVEPDAARDSLPDSSSDNSSRILGRLDVRLVEMSKLPEGTQSFHPKAWRIVEPHQHFVSVGSSNLSRPALLTGVEWNLVTSSREPAQADEQVAAEFERLWERATPLSQQLVTDYAAAAAAYRSRYFVPETDERRELPTPRAWQRVALESLRALRAAGHQRALVAVATGMGKTWLAAFDACQMGEQLQRRPRVLIVAHRAHILAQAEQCMSWLLDATFGPTDTSWYVGSRAELDGELVVASIQKLARPEGLRRLAAQRFDYVMIDEVHHAQAPTYRRVLAKLQADFVLGLTATPERADGVDVATIFDDNLAHQATIGEGIVEGALVPFHYLGIKDTVDFRQVPWRNGRFELEELEAQVARSERMERLWQTLQQHPAARTIVFCCSRRHAVFARDWFRDRGVQAAAVFSGEGSDSYGDSLQGLRSGKLQTLCVVDMFNEGLDIPAVDRVVMLRPTESKVVFLQQLGRGLRATEGKTRLLVIDFVGNHRIFAQRLLHLLSLHQADAGWNALKQWLQGKPPELPPGCLLDVELEAKDLLKQFLPQGRAAAIEGYRALRDELGRRPTALEVFHRGYLPKTISAAEDSWFAFAAAEGDLTEPEQRALERHAAWLKTVETTSLNKCYKMAVLRVLLDSGEFFTGMPLADLAHRSRRYLLHHHILRHDLAGDRHALDHETASDEAWAAWWTKWPVDRWLDKQNGVHWFVREEDRFRFAADGKAAAGVVDREEVTTSAITASETAERTAQEFSEPEQEAFERMTAELVDWRLAAYAQSNLAKVARDEDEFAFEAKVSHTGGRPILFLPDRKKHPDLPTGTLEATLPTGEVWEFVLVKVACNVATPKGTKKNQLPELLRTWFGPDAGQPGTNYRVQFEQTEQGWRATPQSPQ